MTIPQCPPAFFRALQSWDAKYDPTVELVKEPFSSPGYHTTLHGGFVHPTRESLNYAVACLDAGDEERRQRACAILRKVVALQDTDPSRDTYGIWSWFYEEPLTQMSPPDWNWADFCGAQLLQAMLDHRERLDPDLPPLLEHALCCASESIIRRNAPMSYTNIAIMGTYVTLVSGELFGWQDIATYGAERLRRFHAYTMAHGLTEYNSPTYTRVAISELSRLLHHAATPEARALAEELHTLAWLHFARRFHAPTRQWGGPHSRCYQTLQGREFLSFLQFASGGRLTWLPDEELEIDLDWPRLGYHIPEATLPYLLPSDTPRNEVEEFLPATEESAAVVGTTYLHPDYCLGSVNHGDLWNQRRAVVAYWGAPEHPSYLRVRMLHDGYDFCTGYLFTAQRENALLGVATLLTDGNDTHIYFDPLPEGKLRAHDLRFRLEIGGPAAAAITTRTLQPGEPLALTLDGLTLSLHVPHALYDGQPLTGQLLASADAVLPSPHPSRETGDVAALDFILYQGEETTIDIPALRQTAIAFALQCHGDPTPPPTCTTTDDHHLTLRWGDALTLTAPIGPLPRAVALRAGG